MLPADKCDLELLGYSGIGKTTLAQALSRVGNDFTYLSMAEAAHAVAALQAAPETNANQRLSAAHRVWRARQRLLHPIRLAVSLYRAREVEVYGTDARLAMRLLARKRKLLRARGFRPVKRVQLMRFYRKNLAQQWRIPMQLRDHRVLSDEGLLHNFVDAILSLAPDPALDTLFTTTSVISLSAPIEWGVANLRRRHAQAAGATNDWYGYYGGDTTALRQQIETAIHRQQQLCELARAHGCRVLELRADEDLSHNVRKVIAFASSRATPSVRSVQTLSKAAFYRTARCIGGGHWASAPLWKRWNYHDEVLKIIRAIELHSPRDVLELGTMGMQLVPGSDTLDRDDYWDFPGKHPTFLHDARVTPWPATKKYVIIVALRIFQYLVPRQREAFLEAKRLCRHLIIVVPPVKSYQPPGLAGSHGINRAQFTEFNDGVQPTRSISTAMGELHYWDFG